jgi:ABC-type polysaccharide/polyol phosphate export permease
MSRPTTVFEPPALGRIQPLADIRRLQQFGDLFVTLALHRIKVRYRQSRLGLLRAVIQPLGMMLAFTFMFTFLRTSAQR